MGLNHPTPLPMLMPWVDVTPLRGLTMASGYQVAQDAGLYASCFHALGYDGTIDMWQGHPTTPYDYSMDDALGWYVGTVSSDYADDWAEVMKLDGFSIAYGAHPILYPVRPSRPLSTIPTLEEQMQVSDRVTLGGVSYRLQHSHRRIWSVDLLLDGPLDGNSRTLRDFGRFLDLCELGITLWLDRTMGQSERLNAACYPGMPNIITGRLVGASSTRFAPQSGLSRRYPITLQIAEVAP